MKTNTNQQINKLLVVDNDNISETLTFTFSCHCEYSEQIDEVFRPVSFWDLLENTPHCEHCYNEMQFESVYISITI